MGHADGLAIFRNLSLSIWEIELDPNTSLKYFIWYKVSANVLIQIL